MLESLKAVWFRLTSLLNRRQLDAGLTEEMNLHRDLLVEDARLGGVPDAEARRLAAVRLGNATLIRERSREWWSFPALETVARDLRYAARFLRRSPVFTTVAVLSIALGVGANAAVFTIVDRVFLRPPDGVTDAGAIRRLYLRAEAPGRPAYVSGLLDWEEYSAVDVTPSFRAVAGFQYPSPVKLRTGYDAPTADRSLVTSHYFDLLGVRAAIGRLFAIDDHQDGAAPAIVLAPRVRLGFRSHRAGTDVRRPAGDRDRRRRSRLHGPSSEAGRCVDACCAGVVAFPAFRTDMADRPQHEKREHHRAAARKHE